MDEAKLKLVLATDDGTHVDEIGPFTLEQWRMAKDLAMTIFSLSEGT